MKLRILLILLLPVLFSLSGCSQPKGPKVIKLIGNIALMQPDTKTQMGYILVMIEEEYDKNIIYNYYISELSGNDTLLIAKCRNREDSAAYYKVTHNIGQLPFNAIKIDLKEYEQLKGTLKSKYHFKE
jgi:hypothetical protein